MSGINDRYRTTKDVVLFETYRLYERINAGSFGEIIYAINMQTGQKVAVKMENSVAEVPMLLYESQVYKILNGRVGVPRIHCSGTQNGANALVMDLLGPSLENLFEYCSRRFTMKTVLLLADQMLDRIQTLHDSYFIHRDIKPDNFLMGYGSRCSNVYIVDFGMAKQYRDFNTGKHISYREGKNLNRTARYVSVNTHVGIEQSRRDDLESIGYVLMYFNLGTLPWQGIKGASQKAKYEMVKEKKMSTTVEQLCQNFPREFSIYLNYTRRLGFDETPDYRYLRQLFKNLFLQKNLKFDHSFDWVVIGKLKAQSMAQPNDYDFRQAQNAYWNPNNPHQQL